MSKIMLFSKIALAILVFAVIFLFSCSDFPEIPYEARLSEISSSEVSSDSETSSSSSEVSSSSETSSSSSEVSSSSEISSSSEASSSSILSSSSVLSSSSSYLGKAILIEGFENDDQSIGQWFTIEGNSQTKIISFGDTNYHKHHEDNTGFFLEFKEYSYLKFNNAGRFKNHGLQDCRDGLRYSYKGTQHTFEVSFPEEDISFYKAFDESPNEWVTETIPFENLIRYTGTSGINTEQPIQLNEISKILYFNWSFLGYPGDKLLAIDDIYCLIGD